MDKKCSNPHCNKKISKSYSYKGKNYCYNCYKKHFTIIPNNWRTSLKDALEKTYEVKGYKKYKNKDTLQAQIHVPSVLIGRKVKLIIEE